MGAAQEDPAPGSGGAQREADHPAREIVVTPESLPGPGEDILAFAEYGAIAAGDLDKQEKYEKVRGLRQDIDERRKYAGHIFRLVCGWLVVVGYVVCAQGFGYGHPSVTIDDPPIRRGSALSVEQGE